MWSLEVFCLLVNKFLRKFIFGIVGVLVKAHSLILWVILDLIIRKKIPVNVVNKQSIDICCEAVLFGCQFPVNYKTVGNANSE